MHTFKDSEGREWRVAVSVASVKRVRDEAGVDLLDVESLPSTLYDPINLVNVLYVLCEPQAQERGLSDQQFGEAMAGDAIDAGKKALEEEIVAFFPQARRPALRKTLDKIGEVQDKAAGVVMERLEGLDVDKELARAMVNLGERSTGSPGSSGSTPDP